MIRNFLLILPVVIFTMCGDHASRMESAMTVSNANLTSFSFDETAAEPTLERKLIKTGDLTFETSDVKITKGAVEVICKELNAYISNETQNNYGDRLQYAQTIRVPASLFDSLISRIEANAIKVESKNIHTQDVTEEFIDVEARLKTKKELETRYKEILKQAKSVQDIVSIESQMATVRSEIESMEGRLQYLRSQVSFSTLNVSYFEIIGTDFGFASKVVRALGQGWDNLLSFLIFIVNLWPFVVLISAFIWLVIRWRKQKKVVSTP
jgi:hypothetical protein